MSDDHLERWLDKAERDLLAGRVERLRAQGLAWIDHAISFIQIIKQRFENDPGHAGVAELAMRLLRIAPGKDEITNWDGLLDELLGRASGDSSPPES